MGAHRGIAHDANTRRGGAMRIALAVALGSLLLGCGQADIDDAMPGTPPAPD